MCVITHNSAERDLRMISWYVTVDCNIKFMYVSMKINSECLFNECAITTETLPFID